MPSLDMLIIDVAGILLIAWLFHLVSRGRLYVGYAAIFVLAVLGGLVTLSVPPLLQWTNRIGVLLMRAPGLVVLMLAFVLLMLIYCLSMLTQVSNRVVSLTQELAIRRASEPAQPTHERSQG